MKKILLLAIIVLSSISLNAQEIKFSVKGLKDTTIYMAKYYGKKMYYADTAVAKNGVLKYDASKHPSGVYAIILPGQKYFEFIIDNEKIEMSATNQDDLIKGMVIKKSENNKIFYEYINYMSDNKKAINELNKKWSKEVDEAKKKEIENEIEALNKKVINYQKEIAKNNPDLFVGKMIKMSTDIELPAAPRDENGVITDSFYVYRYNIEHYWDNVDLTDDNMIHTPIFDNKLEKYFSNQVMIQIPDSINSYADRLIAKTKDSSEIFKYFVHYITNKYERSDIMGMDRIFVHMADTYYCPAERTRAFWMSPENLTKICERADKLRPLLIGAYAPRLILPDSTEQNWIDIYNVPGEYKVLYFWDPNCGHCKKTTPKLQNLYAQKLKDRGVAVIGIGKATGDDFEAWKKFINDKNLTFINIGLTKNIFNQAQENPRLFIPKYTNIESLNYTNTYDIYSTPRIFLLDKNNKILYKQISIAQLEEILDRLQGFEDAKKIYPIEEEEKENKKIEQHSKENSSSH
jgi:thiol-disulfide isomerase/thioredoxin